MYEKLLSIDEVAQYLRISVGTARNRQSAGRDMPPSVRIGRRRLYPEKQLHSWVQEQVRTVAESRVSALVTRLPRGRPRKE